MSGKLPGWDKTVGMVPEIYSLWQGTGWVREKKEAKDRINKIPAISDGGAPGLSVVYGKSAWKIS